MDTIQVAVVALLAGAVVGAGLVAWRKAGATAPPDHGRVEARLEAQAAELRRLADAAHSRDGAEDRLRSEVAAAREVVEALRIRDEERRDLDRQHAEVVRRLATVLAGGASKGRAGENVLLERLSELPPGMLVRNFQVNGKVVEYGLALPDGRRLPVDSKWPAMRELEALGSEQDPARRDVLGREVEKVVAARVREVAQYLDPSLTSPVAVAAVPDAAYAVLRRAHADAFARGVVIVPYGSALPVLLFLYSLVSRFGSAGDVQACLAEVAQVMGTMEAVLENKVARAATMLVNGAEELRTGFGKARGSIARARVVPADGPGLVANGGDAAEERLRVVE